MYAVEVGDVPVCLSFRLQLAHFIILIETV
jgi:hypothetical protein